MNNIKIYFGMYLIAAIVFLMSCSPEESDMYTKDDVKFELQTEYGEIFNNATFSILETQKIDRFDDVSYIAKSKENNGFTLLVRLSSNEVDQDYFEIREWTQKIEDVPHKIDAIMLMPNENQLGVRAPAPDWELVFMKLIWRCKFNFCIKRIVPNFYPIQSNCDPSEVFCD